MKLLHPTDFSSTAEKARALALDLSDRLRAPLHLVHVAQEEEIEPEHASLHTTFEQLNEQIRRRVEEEREHARRQLLDRLTALTPLGGSNDLLWGRPLEQLLAVLPGYQLVVMGAHGANRFDNFFLGGVAGRLVRRSPVPVITVRDEASSTEVARVLLATDFGPASERALEFCRTLAAAGIAVVAGHVLEEQRAASSRSLQGVLEAFGEGVVEDRVLRQGSPVTILPRLAAEVGADVIAIGVRHHPDAVGLLFGSRADALLRSSPVPILSVPLSKG